MMLRGVVMPSFPPAIAPGVRVPEPSGCWRRGRVRCTAGVGVEAGAAALGAADAHRRAAGQVEERWRKTEAAEGSASVAARP